MNEKTVDYAVVTLLVVVLVASVSYGVFETYLRLSAYLAIAGGC